jgi:hypothetical protein
VDSQSREAVESMGLELVRRDESRGVSTDLDEKKLGVTEQIIGWLANETTRVIKRGSSYATSDLFVLLSWTSGLYAICLQTNSEFPVISSPQFKELLGIMATLLEAILDPTSAGKASLRQSALTRVRRAFRSSPKHIPLSISIITGLSKSLPSPLTVFPVLGVAIDVSVHLKHVKEPETCQISSDLRTRILDTYISNVIMSKSAAPLHVSTALQDFIRIYITEEDLAGIVLPMMEKALLRAPENSLSVITEFFAAYSKQLADDHFRRILIPTLSSSKSSNAAVRRDALLLFKVLMGKASDDKAIQFTSEEILSLPKAGKTTGPDHRVALFSMLKWIPTSTAISAAILQSSLPLLAKETHDLATMTLASSLSPHLVHVIRSGLPIDTGTQAILAKEMSSAKPVTRRAFCVLVGEALRDASQFNNDVAKATLAALEGNLKTASAPGAAPLEGYVAVALLLGPYAHSGMYGTVASHSPVRFGPISTLSNQCIFALFFLSMAHRRRHCKECCPSISRNSVDKAGFLRE